jgi:hypothetical protein
MERLLARLASPPFSANSARPARRPTNGAPLLLVPPSSANMAIRDEEADDGEAEQDHKRHPGHRYAMPLKLPSHLP